MATVPLPVITDVVDQQFFVEGQGGAQQPRSYLDSFPDAVYNKALDSVLVTFLYALLGPVGVGLLREQYLEARLEFEEAGVSGADLDSLYTNPFAFARLAYETYDIDAESVLLSGQQRAMLLAADASFRNRAMDFLKGIRAGGTLEGLTLVARSGLNHPVEVVENYRALYDEYCDQPLGISYMGRTTSLNEVIVVPRQDASQSTEQSLILQGEPVGGWFTLSVPLGSNYQMVSVSVVNGSSFITVPDAAACSPGSYVTIQGSPTMYAQVGFAQNDTTIQLVYPNSAGPSGSNIGVPGQPYSVSLSTGSYTAYTGNAQTVAIPYNATYSMIQAALWALPLVGISNVVVTGGPLPDQPITIRFTGALADQNIPALIVNTNTDAVTGVGTSVPQLTDVNSLTSTISGEIQTTTAGNDADGELITMPPGSVYTMLEALNEIRPVTSFVTTRSGQGSTKRIVSNTIYGGSASTEVLRYVTGLSSVNWPAVDGVHWIEAGTEHEAPQPVGTRLQSYQCFHNVNSVNAYTEAALNDPYYEIPSGQPPVWTRHPDMGIGLFSPTQIALYPFLSNYQNPSAVYTPNGALAATPNPLIITGVVDDIGIIDNEYPADYMGLSGVAQLPIGQTFWASSQRSSGDDFLEIDLGSAQAVNYVYFEATNKPYTITVAYDIWDQSPNRSFIPATLVDSNYAPSVTSLTYDATASNPWTVVEINFTNSLGMMVYTRFIRIEFDRTPVNSPFVTADTVSPYSIEVRNLRVGRSVNDRSTTNAVNS